MNTKTEKPKSFGPKTEKPMEKIAKTAKPKIPMPPSVQFGNVTRLNLQFDLLDLNTGLALVVKTLPDGSSV